MAKQLSTSLTQANRKIGILSGVLNQLSAAQLETLEIVTDVNQMTQLMSSLLEAQSGQILAFEAAFADL